MVLVKKGIALRSWLRERIVVCRNGVHGVLYDKPGSMFFGRKVYWGRGRLRLQEVVGSCCMYNTRVRRAKCLLSKITISRIANPHIKKGVYYQKVVRYAP